MGLAVARQREPERLLGAGLADRAGDADEFCRAARPRGACQRDQPLQHVGHHQQRRVLRRTCRACPRRRRPARAPAFSAASTKSWPSRHVLEREERFARRDGAGVDGKARHARRQRALRASRPSPAPSPRPSTADLCSCHLLPQRRLDLVVIAERQRLCRRRSGRFRGPCRRSAARRRARAPRPRRGSPRGGRRSRAPSAPGAPSRMAARIAAGFSLRGLSSVTMTRSAPCAAIAPISGALALVAVAAGAEHHDQLALDVRPQRLDAPSPARPACGRNRQTPARRCASPTRSSRPLAPLSEASAANTAIRRAAGRDREPGRDQRVLDLEAADQRQPELMALARVLDADSLGEAVDRGVEQPDAVAVAADGDELQPALLRRRDHRIAVLVIDVDHRAAAVGHQRFEQPELGREIGLDARMIVEMIAARDW